MKNENTASVAVKLGQLQEDLCRACARPGQDVFHKVTNNLTVVVPQASRRAGFRSAK